LHIFINEREKKKEKIDFLRTAAKNFISNLNNKDIKKKENFILTTIPDIQPNVNLKCICEQG